MPVQLQQLWSNCNTCQRVQDKVTILPIPHHTCVWPKDAATRVGVRPNDTSPSGDNEKAGAVVALPKANTFSVAHLQSDPHENNAGAWMQQGFVDVSSVVVKPLQIPRRQLPSGPSQAAAKRCVTVERSHANAKTLKVASFCSMMGCPFSSNCCSVDLSYSPRHTSRECVCTWFARGFCVDRGNHDMGSCVTQRCLPLFRLHMHACFYGCAWAEGLNTSQVTSITPRIFSVSRSMSQNLGSPTCAF